MAKIVLNDLTSNYGSQALHNSNNDTIENALNDKVLWRDAPSGEPNQMENTLDMNSNQILNLPDAVLAQEPVTYSQLTAAISAAGSGLIASQTELQTGADVVGGVTTFVGITYTTGSNNLFVFRNGNFQTRGVDYNETTSSSITWIITPNISDNFTFVTNISTTNSTTDTSAVTHSEDSSVYNLASYLQNSHVINVKDFGAVADGSTDNYAAIESASVVARANKAKLFFPANKDGSASDYNYSQTLEYNASDVIIEGESTSVRLVYTGVGTGLACKITPAGASIERWGLRNISLYSTTGAIAFDYTGGSYGNCENVEINYTAANAEMLYAIGNTGAGPYFNKFDGLTFFGEAGRTQDAIVMKSDVSGNLADGPNANVFSNIKRGANLRRLVNLVSGTGNMFTNIGGESIEDALVVLNEVPSFADTGTSTSTGNTSLTDTSKTWSTVQGDALNFIGAQVTLTSGIPNETRRVVSNTADTLTLDKPWSQNPGGTVTYRLSKGKAIKNMFTNVRQEGLNTSNPDGIRCVAGARGNEFSHVEIGSLGAGVIFDDEAQEQTNKIAQGDLIVQQYIIENIGAAANQDVILRSGVFGGIRSGSNMCIEYTEVLALGYTAGTATITTDHGGASVGGGVSSTVCKIDSVCTEQAYVTGDKVLRGTTNAGIFCNVTTDGSFGATTDLIINVAYRVQ